MFRERIHPFGSKNATKKSSFTITENMTFSKPSDFAEIR